MARTWCLRSGSTSRPASSRCTCNIHIIQFNSTLSPIHLRLHYHQHGLQPPVLYLGALLRARIHLSACVCVCTVHTHSRSLHSDATLLTLIDCRPGRTLSLLSSQSAARCYSFLCPPHCVFVLHHVRLSPCVCCCLSCTNTPTLAFRPYIKKTYVLGGR